MPWKSSSPGCPCCDDDCLIPIEDYEQWAPSTWDYSNFDLITTNDSDAVLTALPDHPEDKSTHVVEVTVRGEDDGDILRVIVTFDTTSDYLYAEIEVGTVKGYLRLFQVTGGSHFQLGDDVEIDPLAPATDHDVKVCYDGEVLTAIVNTDHSYARVVTATGEYVGVATGAITDEATFKNFRWWIHYDDGGYYGEPNDCPKCTQAVVCEFCGDSETPRFMKITIAGMDDNFCNVCGQLDGTYILTFNAALTFSAAKCVYNVTFSPVCGSAPNLDLLTLSIPTNGEALLQLVIRGSVADQSVIYEFSLGTPVDCFDIDQEVNVSPLSDFVGALAPCDPALSTARIESL